MLYSVLKCLVLPFWGFHFVTFEETVTHEGSHRVGIAFFHSGASVQAAQIKWLLFDFSIWLFFCRWEGQEIHRELLDLRRKRKLVSFSIMNRLCFHGFAWGSLAWWAEGEAGNWDFLFYYHKEVTLSETFLGNAQCDLTLVFCRARQRLLQIHSCQQYLSMCNILVFTLLLFGAASYFLSTWSMYFAPKSNVQRIIWFQDEIYFHGCGR